MSAGGPTSSAVTSSAEFIRASDEYNVAFDLEIWKAQQQAKFRQQLRQAKEALEKKVLQELKVAHARKVDALEARRQELEMMAARVQAAGEALEKRSDQFQAREQAFEARRVRVAEQHETHLQHIEARAKQATETLSAQLDAARAELSEKDSIIRDVRSKLLAAENEYDMLLRKLTRMNADTGTPDGAQHSADAATSSGADVRSRALEAELGAARRTIEEQKKQLSQQHAEMDRLMRENAAQAASLQKSEVRLEELSRRCARIQDEYYAREREHLQRERDQLDARKRDDKRASRQRQLLSMDTGPSRAATTALHHTTTDASGLYARGAVVSPAHRAEDGLSDMLQELRSDVQRALTAHTLGTSRQTTSYIVAEQPPLQSSASAAPHRAAPPPNARTRADPHPRTLCDAAVQTIPSVSTDNVRVSESDSSKKHPQAWDAADPGSDVDEEAYEYAHVEDWEPASVEQSGLPPLPPAQSKDQTSRSRLEHSTTTDGDPVNPSPSPAMTRRPMTLPPEDFARAVDAIPGGDANTTRADMQTFVQQMRVNRQKLLETGVYTETHPVIREMSEKIRTYESFLENQLV